jgi:hypothetical protein
MTDADPSANPADDGAADEDDAVIDEALEALTAGPLIATAEDDDAEAIAEDEIGEDDDAFDEPDLDGVGEAGVPDDDAADDLLAAAEGVPEIEPGPAPIDFEEPGLEEDDEDIHVSSSAVVEIAAPPAAAPPAEQQRLEQLEQVARALTAATVMRDSGRVRRKVSASATGAALVGAIPVILQLVGALNLSPELAATVSAAAATLASFLTGYATPERKPTLQPELVHEVLKQPE